MTPFEVIIIGIIYLFCYGFTIETIIKEEEEKVGLIIFLCIIALIMSIYYAPLTIGKMLSEKLKDN